MWRHLRDNRVVGAYALGVAFIMAWHTVTPLTAIYAASLGASPVGVGAVVSASVVFPLLLGVHVGGLADRYGPGRVARAMSALLAGAFVLLIASRSLGALALALAALGLADLGLAIVTQAYVASVSTPADRDRAFGVFSLWMSLGALAGPIIGGTVADRHGFHAAFGVGLTLAGIAALVSWTLLAPGRRHDQRDRPPALATAAGMLREPLTRHILLVNFAGVFAFNLRQSFYPLYLAHVGMAVTLIGSLISIQALCSMAARPLLGTVTAKFGPARVLAAALICTAMGFGATVLFRTFWPLAAAIGLTGVGMGLLAPLSMSLIAGRAGPSAQGIAAGLRVSAMQLAQLVSPLLCGVAVSLFGLGAAFALGALIAVSGLAPLTRMRAHRLAQPAGP